MNEGAYVLTEADLKWNKLWDLWVAGQVESPYAELMTYDSEVNNGGHDQYFENVANCGDLQTEMAALETILSERLKENLRLAYQIHLSQSEDLSTLQCDRIFCENEADVIQTLESYASGIKL